MSQERTNGSGLVLPGSFQTARELSARERSKMLDDCVAQVGELCRWARAKDAELNEARQLQKSYGSVIDKAISQARTDAEQRHASFVSMSFMARLRWLFLGR